MRSFGRFAGFVHTREASLRRTYDALDADGNGVLTTPEVEAGLRSVCITCPQTRCQYRTRPEARLQHAHLACNAIKFTSWGQANEEVFASCWNWLGHLAFSAPLQGVSLAAIAVRISGVKYTGLW